MAISKVNAVVAASNIPDAFNCTVGSIYQSVKTFAAGVYTVTCASSTVATVDFYSGATILATAVTSSGTVSVNLASAADKITMHINSGTDIPVIVTRTAAALTNSFSGTLDTITTTSTYTGTSASGLGFAVVVGGGGGGGNTNTPGGGASGGVGAKIVTLTGSMSVVIGQGGAANTNGGNTTFAGITAGGGGAGKFDGSGGGGDVATVTGATYSTAVPGANYNADGQSTTKIFAFVVNGTTGGGGGTNGGAGGGDGGIGKGSSTTVTGSGYGAGGAGGGNSTRIVGFPGVVYVLRF